MNANLSADNVRSVYSGRPGCMCGCRGKHRYSSRFVAEATAHRGYEVTPDEVNDRQVTKVCNLLDAALVNTPDDAPKAPDGGFMLPDGSRLYVDPEFVSLETDRKVWTAYLRA